MSCAILLYVNPHTNVAIAIESLLNNSIKPDYLFMLLPKNSEENDIEIAKVFTKSCCDNGEYLEEYSDDCYIIKKASSDCTFVVIHSAVKTLSELQNLAMEEIEDSIDYVITAQSTTIYNVDYIKYYIDKLAIENTGACYSDYIENRKYIFLTSLYPTLTHSVPIKDIGISNKYKPIRFKNSNLDLIVELYGRSIVRHIPEALFQT